MIRTLAGRHMPRAKLASTVALGGLAGSAAVGLVLPKVVAAVSNPRDLAFFLAAAIATGVGFLRPRFAIVATITAFVFSPFLRRLFPADVPAVDLAAIIPFLVAVPLAVRGLRLRKSLNLALLLLWVGLVAGRSLGAPLVAVAGFMNIAIPLAAALALKDIDDGVRLFARTVVICAAIAGVYGVAQYFVGFPWDVRWVKDARVLSVGKFGTPSFRTFGTLAAPGTAATLSAVVLLLLLFRNELLGFGRTVVGWAFASCGLFLLLTQVRAVWISFAVALLVGVLVDPRRRLHRLALPIGGVLAFLVLSPQADVVVNRARTLTDLQSDVSFNARKNLLSQASTLVSPFGRGLGYFSAGSRIDQDASLDNGFIVVLGETGLVGLGLMSWVLVASALRARRNELPFLALLVVSNLTGFLFANLPGLLLWAFSGVGRAPPEPAEDEAEPRLAPVAA